jgi:hypothetical protein
MFLRPEDRVSAIVDRGRDVRPRATDNSIGARRDVGSAAVDVRANANRANAGVRAPISGGSLDGHVGMDSRGVDGRLDVDTSSPDGRARGTVRGDVDPRSGDFSWGASGDASGRSTRGGRSRASSVAAEIERRRSGDVSGRASHTLDTSDTSGTSRHRTSGDFDSRSGVTSGSVDHRTNIDRGGDRYEVHGNASARRDTSGVTGDASLSASRDLADGTHDDANVRVRRDGSGLSGSADANTRRTIGGADVSGSAGVNVRSSGDATVTGSGRATTRDGANRRTYDGSASVTRTSGGAWSASGGAGVDDTTVDGSTVTNRTGRVTGNASSTGGSGTLVGTHRTTDGSDRREVRGEVRGGYTPGGGPTGGVSARYTSATGAGADRVDLDAGGSVDADRNGVRARAEARHTTPDRTVGGDATLNVGRDGTTSGSVRADTRGVTGRGDDRVAYSGSATITGSNTGGSADATGRVDLGDPSAGGVRVDGRGNVAVDSSGVRGRASVDARGATTRGPDDVRWSAGATGNVGPTETSGTVRADVDYGDPNDGGVHVGGTATVANGPSGTRGNAAVRARGGTGTGDDRTDWTASGGVDVGDDGSSVRVHGDASVSRGDSSSRVVYGADAHGDVTLANSSVTGSARVGGHVRVRSTDSVVRETRAEVSTTGGPPTVSVTHDRRDTSTGDRDTVSARAELSDRAAEATWERARRDPVSGNTHRMHARLGVRPDGADANVSRPMPGSTVSNVSATGSLGGAGVTGSVDLGVGSGGETVGGAVGYGDARGNASIRGSVPDLGGTIDANVDGRVEFDSDSIDALLSGTASWDSQWGRAAISLAGHYGQAEKVTDRGPVTDVPALSGTHRVLLESTVHAQGAVGAGMAVGGVGVGATVRHGGVRAMAYLTHMTNPDAHRLSRDGAAANMPDPSKPDQLQTHDLLRMACSGDWGMSADLSLFGVGASGRLTLRGDFTFTVEKLATDRVRITVEPEKITALGLEGRALVAFGSLERKKARLLSQTFDLDLSTPEGKKAYDQALAGELPEAKVRAALKDVDDALDLVEDLNEDLPAGVRAVAFASQTSTTVTQNQGFRWTFFSSSVASSTTTSTRDTAMDGRVVSERAHRAERVEHTWFSGTQKAGVFAIVEHESTRDENDDEVDTQFKSIRFGARFSDDKVKHFEFNDVVKQLRDVLGMKLGNFSMPADGDSQSVEVALELDTHWLEGLDITEIRMLPSVALLSGSRRDFAKALMIDLKNNPLAADRARILQDYVKSEGLAALGTLMQTFKDVPVQMTGVNTLYEEAIRESQDAVGRYPGQVDVFDLDDFCKRVDTAQSIVRKLKLALDTVHNDPFLSATEVNQLEGDLYRQIDDAMQIANLEHATPQAMNAMRSRLGRSLALTGTTVYLAFLDRWRHRTNEPVSAMYNLGNYRHDRRDVDVGPDALGPDAMDPDPG